MRDRMKQWKRVITFLILFLLICFGTVEANETDIENIDDMLLEDVSLGGIQQFWDELVTEYSGYLPEIEKISLYEFIKNNDSLSFKGAINGLIKFLFYELILNGKLLGLLLMLTLFSLVLQTMHNAFE